MEELNTLNIDAEDLEDVLSEMESSFGIRFEEDEIPNLISIEEIADRITSKLNYPEGIECSTQIVFYYLRDLLSQRLRIDKETIKPDIELEELFPKKGRRKKWKAVFKETEYKVPVLEAHSFVFFSLLLTLASFILIFFHLYALPVFLVAVLTTYLFFRFARSLPCRTLGDLSKKIAQQNYAKTRSRAQTINSNEIKQLILNIFSEWVDEPEKKIITLHTRIDYLNT